MIKRKDKTVVNSIANLVSKGWSILSTYIFIPQYIAYLGEEAYGLVSFFATLYSAMQLLGIGLSSTLRREFAAGDDGEENRNRQYKLLRSVENIYYLIALIVFCICYFGRNFIANRWLSFNNLDPATIETVLSLMGVSIGLQLVGNLYFGCIMGTGNQIIANAFDVGWAVLKSVGSLLVCILTGSIIYFYFWHIFSDLIYIISQRIYLTNYLGIQNRRWQIKDFVNLQTIWRYTLGLFAISIVSVINKQFDKTIISGVLSLSELGAYNLATTLGTLTMFVPNAVSAAVFATFTKEYTTQNHRNLQRHYFLYSKIVSIICTCMGSFIAVFSYELILVWTNNLTYASIIRDAAPFVIIANTLIGLQSVPYSLALSHGNTKINNVVGIVSLPVICITTYYAIKFFGLNGAGVAYFILMFLQTIIYVYWVTKKYTDENAIKFIAVYEMLPMCLSLLGAYCFKVAIRTVSQNTTIIALVGVVSGGIALSILVYAFLKKDLKEILKLIKREK